MKAGTKEVRRLNCNAVEKKLKQNFIRTGESSSPASAIGDVNCVTGISYR